MKPISTLEVRRTAEKQLYEEAFKKAVDDMKIKLLTKRNIWDIVFPYKIILVKKRKD